MSEITFSDKFDEKFMNATYIETGSNWFSTIVSWVIDSKFRRTKRLDKFLSDQLINPHENLKLCAKNFQTGSFDYRIIQILKFVYKDVRYRADYDAWGKTEYWATAIETLNKGNDDCDGINALIYILARLAHIPSWMIRCNIGSTAAGGHFWMTYYCGGGKWTAIDGTYYPDMRPINFRPEFKLNIKTYQDIWYIFNEDKMYKYRK